MEFCRKKVMSLTRSEINISLGEILLFTVEKRLGEDEKSILLVCDPGDEKSSVTLR